MPKKYLGRTGEFTWSDFVVVRREMRRFIAILFIVMALYVTALAWLGEHNSCERSRATRVTQRSVLIELQHKGTVSNSQSPPPPLSCSKPLPDH